jgi:hypothetical protein
VELCHEDPLHPEPLSERDADSSISQLLQESVYVFLSIVPIMTILHCASSARHHSGQSPKMIQVTLSLIGVVRKVCFFSGMGWLD